MDETVKDCVVVATKGSDPDRMVETFGPFTHAEADIFAMSIAECTEAEWSFHSQQVNTVDVETAGKYLTAL